MKKVDPVLIRLEHLRSLKWACWPERLCDKTEIIRAENVLNGTLVLYVEHHNPNLVPRGVEKLKRRRSSFTIWF